MQSKGSQKMESPQPPKKPEIVIIQSIDTQQSINKTLPLTRQKSNFEQKLDSFEEKLSLQQNQLDLFKTKLSECQNQTNKDHKHLKRLNKGVEGLIEDQGRTNRELKTNMANLDTEHLRLDVSIDMLAQTGTKLEERVKIVEQNIFVEQSYSSIPKIMITPPNNTQKDLLSYKNETHEKFKKLEKTIADLVNLKEEQEDALIESQQKIEQNEKDIALLKAMVIEQQATLQKLTAILDNKNSS